MSTAGSINFQGIVSGLNVSSIIGALTSANTAQVTQLQTQQTTLQTQQTAFDNIKSQVQSFAGAVAALSNASTYNGVTANPLDSSVATVTTGQNAAAGTYNLSVTQLAQAEKIASAAQSSSTSALNLSGQFMLNGSAITVTSADTLSTLANKINSSKAGVNAAVINGGTGQAYLTLQSQQTGASNAIQASDLTGGILSTLGVVTGTAAFNKTGTNTVSSTTLTSSSQTLGSLTGYSGSGSVSLNGTSVNVNFSTDSLQTVANNINAANTGIAASVVTSTKNGSTVYQLQLIGNGVPAGVTDTNGLLGAIGVTQQAAGNSLLGAQDAKFSVDTLQLSSATNSVSNVLPGLSISLLKANSSTSITVAHDTSAVSTAITNVQTAYNTVIQTIASDTAFDSGTNTSGPLLGDSALTSIKQGMANTIFQTFGTGSLSNLTQLGLTFAQDGTLSLDSSKLSSQLTSNLQGVQKMLMPSGTASVTQLNYVSAGAKAVSSNSTGYAVNISQAATQSQFVGSSAQTSPLSAAENLTFGGGLFGNSTYNLTLNLGSSASDIVNQINSDATLKPLVTASLNGAGELQVTSNRYGATSAFTLTSDTAASSSSSGIKGGTSTTGVDVAGTINGEAATGSGQYLLGNSGNKNTDGLQVQYTGTTAGLIGTLNYQAGAANSIGLTLNAFLDPVSGIFAVEDNSITTQVNDLTKKIASTNAQNAAETATLTNEFNNMESALSEIQSQSTALNSILGTTSTSTSSTSSTGSHASTSTG